MIMRVIYSGRVIENVCVFFSVNKNVETGEVGHLIKQCQVPKYNMKKPKSGKYEPIFRDEIWLIFSSKPPLEISSVE